MFTVALGGIPLSRILGDTHNGPEVSDNLFDIGIVRFLKVCDSRVVRILLLHLATSVTIQWESNQILCWAFR